MSVRTKYTAIALVILTAMLTAGFFLLNNEPAHAENNIVTPEYMISCVEGETCILIGTTCDGCCNYIAINEKFKDEHNTLSRETCQVYNGSSCECESEFKSATCIEGRCQLSKEINP